MTIDAAPPRRTPGEHLRRAQIAEGTAFGLGGPPLGWVASSGASVATTLITWDHGDIAELPTGLGWDIVTVPTDVGWKAVRYLGRMRVPAGPVLSTGHDVCWFVTPGTADGWDLAVGSVLPSGQTFGVPHPAITTPHAISGRSWIVQPREQLTDGADLYGACAAYSASRAMHLGAAS
ncbi:hypothetical protein ACIGW3_26385 [Streptomyces sp. NPDC053499]|uniref:hypothetical protein n=1 Tax=Streptomyces sp. NPDC053499 TaxID=3365707 RepID=UPI0037D036E4